MKENSTLAEMSDKDGRKMLRMYPMSFSNHRSKKSYRWKPVNESIRRLSLWGSALFHHVNMHDINSEYTPDSVLMNLTDVRCNYLSVLYFMSTHQWEKYKMFNAEKGAYKNERILAEIYTPPMMSLTHMKEDKPNNLYDCALYELKASLRGMADGKLV